MKEFIENIAKHQFHNGEWIDIQTDIDFSKYRPKSRFINEDRYDIDGNKYRLLYNNGSARIIQILKFDIEETHYTFSPRINCNPDTISKNYYSTSKGIVSTRYEKLSYKKIYPNGDKIGGGNLLMFDVIWSDDKSLVPAAILGFPTNQYKNFKYRLLPKQLGEMYQYIYEV